ncbi:MAG TPA: helix-hairpin-helix domain-containing protein [Chitinophagaceae bacterium]|nr:helix-hairpin-helix domain-containing protein [Chitinophagaceae bacterium]
MDWKNVVKDYLFFSKKDRIGLFCALGIIFLIILMLQFSVKSKTTKSITNDTLFVSAIDTLQQRGAKSTNRYNNDAYNSASYQYDSKPSDFTKGELFKFDPNTLPLVGWKQLGLSDKTIKTINNYRTKGGKFYKPEDLQKIWGLPQGFYERVEEYIQIDLPKSDNRFTSNYTTAPKYERKERSIAVVNINNADTAAFIALPGIGAKLALRITAFRDKLGGFYSVDQIKETYGLPDSTFQKIKPYLNADASGIKKFNINTATKDELKVHPYIRWNLANAIVEYRNQHGKFTNLNDLKNIVVIDEATFAKISPYLTIQ